MNVQMNQMRGEERSPKVGINQLSSMDFRGLASDCVCNHRTPPLFIITPYFYGSISTLSKQIREAILT